MGRLIQRLQRLFYPDTTPDHLRKGSQGEKAAERFLRRRGYKFLARNYASKRGEIDLIFRDRDCMVFVEVKTRSGETWSRPAAAVDADKRKNICKTALDYLRKLHFPHCKIQFDIVEVLLDDMEKVVEVRHLPNAFPMTEPLRYQG